jgi:hypothetical protein
MYGRACSFSTLATVVALALPAAAQSVISTHSGVIHFFEGAVFLGDQPLESHLGRYPSVPLGGQLSTAAGRAEVLLTPGAFLRLGEQSSIRMLGNDLADTQVELQAGSAIMDSGEPNPGTSVTVVYKDWRIHFLQKGSYRIDAGQARLSVRQGEAEVFARDAGEPVLVDTGMSLPLDSALAPERSAQQVGDALSDWSTGRGQSISADNAITAQIDEDPSAVTAGLDGFTYFPFLGVSSVVPLSSTTVSPGVYGSPGLYGSPGVYSSYYQPGFNSIYLPGYTYAPLMLGLLGRGPRIYVPSPQRPIGIGSVRPGSVVVVPRAPAPAPIAIPRPAAVRPAPGRVGVGVGVHR